MDASSKVQAVLDVLSSFKEKMVEASHLRSAIAERFDSELRALKSEKERGCKLESEGIPRSINNMIYHDLKTGNATIYGARHSFLDDQIAAAHLHKNRHYQWVLVEAYEAFEDFLERVYAAMGYADNDFWPESDFITAQMSEVSVRDYEWFINQVKRKKNKPNSILVNFRRSFKDLRNIELKNKCDVHAVFELVLISKLRHLIVHNSGRVESEREVILRIVKEAGVSENYKEALVARASMFFNRIKGTQEVHVYLLGHTKPGLPMFSVYNLSDLMGFLVSYAQTLTEISVSHLYGKGLITSAFENIDPT